MSCTKLFSLGHPPEGGRVFTGPVDGFLFRGRVHFGTSPAALRARHLASHPTVSATHVRGSECERYGCCRTSPA